MTSAKFQTLNSAERHEVLSAMTRDQLIEFTEGFTPSAGLPVGAESCWRTLALRLAIELRYCDCCVPNPCADPNNPACDCVHCQSVDQPNDEPDCPCAFCSDPEAAMDDFSRLCGEVADLMAKRVDLTTSVLEAMSAADVASGLFCRQCRKQTWATKDGYCPDCMPPAVKAAFDKAMSADEVAMIEAAGDFNL